MPTTPPVVKTQRSVGETTHVNHQFHVNDRKGRAIGANVYEAMIEHAEGDGYDAHYSIKPGVYFGYSFSATRGGNAFGPSQPWHIAASASERAEKIGAYLRGAERRAHVTARGGR